MLETNKRVILSGNIFASSEGETALLFLNCISLPEHINERRRPRPARRECCS